MELAKCTRGREMETLKKLALCGITGYPIVEDYILIIFGPACNIPLWLALSPVGGDLCMILYVYPFLCTTTVIY
jgi:hypothetical protein